MELVIHMVDWADRIAGDVVVAMPDGHSWSKTELSNPDWRIVRVPITQVEATALTSSDESFSPSSKFVSRKYNIALASLPGELTKELSKPAVVVLDASPYLVQIRAASKLKAK
jgi:hypothetical protein